MNLAEKIFKRKKIIPELLIKYGFTLDDKYYYQKDIMDGDTGVNISIFNEEAIHVEVIDKLNNEE